MYSKKNILKIFSIGMISLCGISFLPNVSATSMKKILPDVVAKRNSPLKKIKSDVSRFVDEENARLVRELAEIEDFRRMDSLAFAIFCCSCYKEQLMTPMKQVVLQRNREEFREDLEVLNFIMPNNPKYFAEKFGLEVDRADLDIIIEYLSKCKFTAPHERVPRKPERVIREQMREGVEFAEEIRSGEIEADMDDMGDE